MRSIAPLAWAAILCSSAAAQQPKIYWGDAVSPGSTGTWPDELRTVAEQSNFTRTMSTLQLHEYINTLRWRSEHVHVVTMFTSPRGKIAPSRACESARDDATAVANGEQAGGVPHGQHPPG